MSTLDAFFREIRPLLLGESAPERFLERLGPSPSGARRVGLYTRLVGNDLAAGLEGLYPAVHVAVDRVGKVKWRALVDAFYAAHPPAHWDLNRCGEGFPAFLAARRDADPAEPAFLAELADLAWTEYSVYTSATVIPGRGLNPTAELRQYGHAVVPWASLAKKGTAEGLPAPGATAVLVYRNPETLLTKSIVADGMLLLALAKEQGVPSPAIAAAAEKAGPEAMAAARARLLRAGLLLG